MSEAQSMPKDELEIREVDGDIIPLVEKAIRADGTVPVKLIAPGWGTSGFYSEELLERDGPKVFTSGTHMFWDHPTGTEEAERPEGSLKNLAAVLVNDAQFKRNGPDGPGLYAEAKTFGGYREVLQEIAPHIGVSIRASGKATTGESEGREGVIISEITSAKSADFVTIPGAGGKIVELFESARTGQKPAPKPEIKDDSMSEQLEKQLSEAQASIAKLTEQNAQLAEQNARVSESLLIRESRDYVQAEVAKAELPDVTKSRLVESLCKSAPIVDGKLDKEAFAATIAEAINAEADYLRQVSGHNTGRITGMGSHGQQTQYTDDDREDAQRRLTKAFSALGLNESGAKSAANGREF